MRGGGGPMLRRIIWAGIALLCLASAAYAERPETYDKLIAAHAAANGVPESLVHRVITRESRYNPHLIGHCGCMGLMQIKLGTARSLGYEGTAQGLLDRRDQPDLRGEIPGRCLPHRGRQCRPSRRLLRSRLLLRGQAASTSRWNLTSDVRPASRASEGILGLPEESRTENEKKPVRAMRTAAMSARALTALGRGLHYPNS